MRVNESRLLELIAGAELGESLGHSGNIIDHLALDVRDLMEAVKILNPKPVIVGTTNNVDSGKPLRNGFYA
jgi:hypothetical protein